jgi:hypothetical protein
VHEVLGELDAQSLGGADHRAVDVAEHRYGRIAERDAGEDASELVACAAHERRVARDADRQARRLASADRLAHLEREDECRDDARQHDLPGGVGVRDTDLAVGPRLVDDVVDLLVGQAHHRAHATGDAALLHDSAALADETQRIGVVDGVGGDGGGILPGRVAGQRPRDDLDPGVTCLVAHGVQVRHARGEDRGLRVHRQVELVGRPLQDEPGQRDAEGRIGALEGFRGRRGAGNELGAHADVLRALAGEDERDAAGRGGSPGIGLLGHHLRAWGMLPGV